VPRNQQTPQALAAYHKAEALEVVADHQGGEYQGGIVVAWMACGRSPILQIQPRRWRLEAPRQRTQKTGLSFARRPLPHLGKNRARPTQLTQLRGVGSIARTFLGGLFILSAPNIAGWCPRAWCKGFTGFILIVVIYVLPSGAAGFVRLIVSRVAHSWTRAGVFIRPHRCPKSRGRQYGRLGCAVSVLCQRVDVTVPQRPTSLRGP
jgi:hypothetical protein